MKILAIIVVSLLFIIGSLLTYESMAAEVASCEVKTMCVVACGAGYVKCTGKDCEKGSTWVKCDNKVTNCCGADPQ